MTQNISLTNLQAPNQEIVVRVLAAYLERRLGISADLIVDPPWQERQRHLDGGHIDIAWICGLPYVLRAGAANPALELLAAPVMQGARYEGRPIYFSDVIVRQERSYQVFDDLQGSVWAFNEPGSQSGFNITRYHLASINAPHPFFARVVEGGSHEACIRLVLDGSVDAAAIDSTVLEIARQQITAVDKQLRVVTVLGPSPIPPLVVSRRTDPALRKQLKDAILDMHVDPDGRQLLQQTNIQRFVSIRDQDYDAIRDMARLARDVQWK